MAPLGVLSTLETGRFIRAKILASGPAVGLKIKSQSTAPTDMDTPIVLEKTVLKKPTPRNFLYAKYAIAKLKTMVRTVTAKTKTKVM